MIAVLFADPRGVYAGLPDVDLWDAKRDARLYPGPWPVVAHPPCARWGVMAERAFGRTYGRLGDDDGCFAAALASVRRYGGVLEHPEHSRAFACFGLPVPDGSGWQRGLCGGWSASVEQGHYGHRTRKRTWLYAYGMSADALPALAVGVSCPDGYQPCARKGEAFTRLSRRQRSATPPQFRDMLLEMARGARRVTA